MPEPVEQNSNTTRFDYKKWGSVAQLVSAAAATIGFIVALWAISYYAANVSEQKSKLSSEALFAWKNSQPPNTRPCLELLSKLSTSEWTKIIARQEFPVSLPERSPALDGHVRACFSEQEHLDHFLNNGSLTLRGVALLASKANGILEADDVMAGFMLQKIGNQKMFDRVADIICRDDPQIIGNLPTDPRTLDSFLRLRKFKDAPYPDGCHVPPRTAAP